MEAEGKAVPERTAPVREVRQLTRPVRSTARWAVREDERLERVRYLEVNGRRWLDRVRALSLDEKQSEELDVAMASLEGFDALAVDERRKRLKRLLGALNRLGESRNRRSDEERAEKPARTKSSARAEGSKTRRGSRRRKAQTAPAPRVQQAPAPAPRVERKPAPPPARALHDSDGLSAPLAELGVPESQIQLLEAADIETGLDLVWTPPVGVEHLKPLHGAGRPLPDGERLAVGGRLVWKATCCKPDGSRVGLVGLRGAGLLIAELGPLVPAEALEIGTKVVLVGESREHRFVATERATGEGKSGVRLARYGLDEVDDSVVRAAVRQVLEAQPNILDAIPGDILQRLSLPEVGKALVAAHLSPEIGGAPQQRLLFEEALLVAVGQAAGESESRKRGIPHTLGHTSLALASQLREWNLSDAQQSALEEIKRDLRSSRPMRRLLTGEAGTDKGLIATMAAILATEGRTQVAWLTPTAALATQRAVFLERILKDLGLVVRSFSRTPDEAQRDAIRRGEVHLIVGPRDLDLASVEFRRLGLVIAEERRTGGWAERVHERLGSPTPDLLVLNPTPVATALLHTTYGGFDISYVRGPQIEVPSAMVDARERQAAYASLVDAVRGGRQGVVLFPMLRGKDVLGQADAVRLKNALSDEFFSGLRVGLLHGGMSGVERMRVLEEVRSHQLDVLVSTTAFEDGPPMDRVTVGIIEEANRVDPVRLLRIRRHLAGPDGKGRCFLVFGSDADGEDRQRVSLVTQADDGMQLAEAEVARLGVGPFIEEGPIPEVPDLRWAGTRGDLDVLLEARRSAHRMLVEDPALRRRSAAALAQALAARWNTWLPGDPPLAPAKRSNNRRRRRKRR